MSVRRKHQSIRLMFQDVPERTLMRCSGENRRFPTKQNDHLEAAQASLSNLDTHSSCCSAVRTAPVSLEVCSRTPWSLNQLIGKRQQQCALLFMALIFSKHVVATRVMSKDKLDQGNNVWSLTKSGKRSLQMERNSSDKGARTPLFGSC